MEKYLSERDIELIHDWVYYSHGECDIPRWLQEWKRCKDNYLFKMFNNQLIHTAPYTYEKPLTEKVNELWESNYDTIDTMYWHIRDVLDILNPNIMRKCHSTMSSNPIENCYSDIKYVVSAIRNINYMFSEFIIQQKNISIEGIRSLKIHANEKWNKVVRKFMKFLSEWATKDGHSVAVDAHLSAAETLINKILLEISRINNSVALEAPLSLSIHPLDYLTMSNNACGWESCMAWECDDICEAGCYHAGTVEMMNSPSVVVAYLESEEPFEQSLCGTSNPWSWNNKRWRCLFIVDKNMICGVKEYPYHDEAMVNEVTRRLAALAQENLGWSYRTDDIQSKKSAIRPDGKEQNFSTNLMYKDICSSNIPAIIWATDFDNNFEMSFNYSGIAYCPICGEELDNADRTVCASCSDYIVCDCCGDEYDINYEWYVDENNEYYCQSCYENYFRECSYCEGYYYSERMIEFIVPYTLKEPQLNWCTNEYETKDWMHRRSCWICSNCWEDMPDDMKQYFKDTPSGYTFDCSSFEDKTSIISFLRDNFGIEFWNAETDNFKFVPAEEYLTSLRQYGIIKRKRSVYYEI